MIPSTKEFEPQQTKKEESAPNGASKFGNTKTLLSSSRQWSTFRNPRIVRVSRSFGGKDRHSKVCTVRGLRDRRIRLSVPTAIQLYDLQERLGLSQPSKVIDWLMDSTKDDIDKLPPLQLPQGSFCQFLQQSITGVAPSPSYIDQIAEPNPYLPLFFDGTSSLFSSEDPRMNNVSLQNHEIVGDHRSKYWDYLDAASKAKSKEVERDNELNQDERLKWIAINTQHSNLNHFQRLRGYNNTSQVSAQNIFPVARDSPYNAYNQSWDPTSILALAQTENRGITSSLHQLGNDHNNSSLLSASSSSTFGPLIPSIGPQLFFHPPTSAFFPVTTTAYPSYSTMSSEAADPRQVSSHLHIMSHSSSIKTFQLHNANGPNKLLQSPTQQDENNTSS